MEGYCKNKIYMILLYVTTTYTVKLSGDVIVNLLVLTKRLTITSSFWNFLLFYFIFSLDPGEYIFRVG